MPITAWQKRGYRPIWQNDRKMSDLPAEEIERRYRAALRWVRYVRREELDSWAQRADAAPGGASSQPVDN